MDLSLIQVKSTQDHIRDRSGMYMPQREAEEQTVWLAKQTIKQEENIKEEETVEENKEDEEKKKPKKEIIPTMDVSIVRETHKISRGFMHLFEEMIVNASDNKVRDKQPDSENYHKCCKMTQIDVEVNAEEKYIRVSNNGSPITTEKMGEQYVPEILFSVPMSSTNYGERRTETGGFNGLGVKVVNIFSKRFEITILDPIRAQKYHQVWENNKEICHPPTITKYKSKSSLVEVKAYPDMEKFPGMNGFDSVVIETLLHRLCTVVATMPDSKSVKVTFNGKSLIKCHSLSEYLTRMQLGFPVLEDSPHPNLSFSCSLNTSGDKMQQVSFVNGVHTVRGGRHVKIIEDLIRDEIYECLQSSRNRDAREISKADVIKHLFLVVSCKLPEPGFDGQSKECLNSTKAYVESLFVDGKPTKTQSAKLSSEFSSRLRRSGIPRLLEERILSAKLKKAGKKDSRSSQRDLHKIPNFEDAEYAGTKDAHLCTLFLVEGNSAMSLAMLGFDVVGRKFFGVLALRGKLRNAHTSTLESLLKDRSFNHIKQILGISEGSVYQDTKQLRYGRLCLMTDQDKDGIHISSLVVCWLRKQWPSLLRLHGFFFQFITPVVRARGRELVEDDQEQPVSKRSKNAKGVSKKKWKDACRTFFVEYEFETWYEKHKQESWVVKYYKGLGSNTEQEAKEYFANMDRHLVEIRFSEDEDLEAIDRAFSQKRSDERKRMVIDLKKENHLRFEGMGQVIRGKEYVEKHLALFWEAQALRNLMGIDARCEAERKVYFTAEEKNLYEKDMKVAQLAAAAADRTNYLHGEQNLTGVIAKNAQWITGKGNIATYIPKSQMGTRRFGGADAANPRYTFAALAPIMKAINPREDFPILPYDTVNGKKVEPMYYVPIVPMPLINGGGFVGSGWSSFVPQFHPMDVLQLTRTFLHRLDPHTQSFTPEEAKRMLEDTKPLIPWYREFEGETTPMEDEKHYWNRGAIHRNGKYLLISELPIGTWTGPYLTKLRETELKEGSPITNVMDHSTTHRVCISLEFVSVDHLDAFLKKEVDLYGRFHLRKSLRTSNMVLLDRDRRPRKFDSILEIACYCYYVRYEYYEKRKIYQLQTLDKHCLKLKNKIRFLRAVIDKQVPTHVEETILNEYLEKEKYDKFGSEDKVEDESYDYLLNMPIRSLTLNRLRQMEQELERKTNDHITLEKTHLRDLWLKDLDVFEKALKEHDEIGNNMKANPVDIQPSGSMMNLESQLTGKRKRVANKQNKVGEEARQQQLEGAIFLPDQKNKPSLEKTDYPEEEVESFLEDQE